MGRTAVVTGGTGGLGCAVTERLLHEGWRVVVPWIVEAELARLAPHPRLELVEADLFDAEAVASVVSTAAAAPDAPLIAVANLVGGFAMGGRLHETPVDDFEQVLRLNLRPTYLRMRSCHRSSTPPAVDGTSRRRRERDGPPRRASPTSLFFSSVTKPARSPERRSRYPAHVDAVPQRQKSRAGYGHNEINQVDIYT
jgi:NAD(P)-dependent dehydrogenase (short-subunit alcohol dehydrogenase family)